MTQHTPKITPAMRVALQIVSTESHRYYEGCTSAGAEAARTRTLRRLRDAGLIETRHGTGWKARWAITEAGRAALKQSNGG